MPPIEAGLALVRMTLDGLQDAAGYVCAKRDYESANGDDEDEEEEEGEENKKEQGEEDEDDDDDDDGARRVRESSTPGFDEHRRGHGRAMTLRPAPFPG